MDALKDFFSFIFNFVGWVGSVLGIWALVKSPEEVKATLISWGKYVQSLIPAKRPKQTANPQSVKNLSEEDLSAIFDSPGRTESKNGVKSQPQKRVMTYLYVLAGLVLISFIVISMLSKPAYPPEAEMASPPIEWTASGGMNIVSLFWMYVCFFGAIGWMRGWLKEILVIFSAFVALAVNALLFEHVPFINDLPDNSVSLFWARSLIMIILVYFGYQMILSVPRLNSRAVRERLTDSIFGALTGGINGYLVAGSILTYFHVAGYPYKNIIAPATDANFSEIVAKMMTFMPPSLLGEPGVYFVVIILVAFLLVVYI